MCRLGRHDAPVALPRDALWAYRDHGPMLDE